MVREGIDSRGFADSKSLMEYEGKSGNRTKFPLDFYNKVCYNS